MALKPQDVLVCLHLSLQADMTWTYGALNQALKISVGELHNSIVRLQRARLVGKTAHCAARLNYAALEEFLIHGVKYAFAAECGGRTRGLPTGAGASPLNELLMPSGEEIPVWPEAQGTTWGYEFAPLYKTVPWAAQQDPKLYELLALVDSIRGGGARERKLAEELLRDRLKAAQGLVRVQASLINS